MGSQAAALSDAGRRAQNRRRVLIPLAALILALALLQTARIAGALNRLMRDGQTLQVMAQNGTFALTRSDRSAETNAQLERTLKDYAELRSVVGPWVYVGPLLGWVPRFGGDLANAPALLDFGDHASAAAYDTFSLGSALNAEMGDGAAPAVPIGVAILKIAQTHAALVQHARASLVSTAQSRSNINAAQLSPSLRDALGQFDQMLPVWTAGLDALSNAPTLMGADRPRTYLLVAQNSDEMRPTGGFVTGVALLQVDQGRITVGEFQDSYAVDDLSKTHPTPSPSMTAYLDAGMVLFRDANWSPDFPTTARLLEDIYQTNRGTPSDGVIAINQRALPELVDAFGSIALPAEGGSVNADNVMAQIYAHWAPPPGEGATEQWWEHHKDFIGEVFQAMMPRLMDGDFDQARFAKSLGEAIITKDVLIYLNEVDSASQTSLLRGGSLYQGTGDALMLVDANVGFNKVDPSIDRRAVYSVTLDSAGAGRATMAITHTNLSAATGAFCVHEPHYLPNYADMQQGCYWDYMRVVAPAKSQLISATPALQARPDEAVGTRAAFGGYMLLGLGSTKAVRFDYSLPQVVDGQSDYVLHLEKQPGAPTMPVTVRVTLPAGWGIRSAVPAPTRQAGSTVEFAVTLDRDQVIQISLNRPPVLLFVGVLAVLGAFALLWATRRTARAATGGRP
ncbi:MAG: DUF4012 domain-containing protein [Chloroflexi bacterium]|nr:DUF4012 domain-containing protein [Chloroflexota bacterium]